MIDEDPRIQLQQHIPTGKPLLWAGRPDPSVWFAPADKVMVPGTVFMAAFIAFWLYLAISGGAPLFFAAFGGVFALGILYLAVGRFVVKARRARRTAYGLTADTAYIVTGGAATEIPLREAPLTVNGSSDGAHVTVALERRPDQPWWRRNKGFFGVTPDNTGAEMVGGGSFTNAFYDVADVAGLRRALDAVNRELDRR